MKIIFELKDEHLKLLKRFNVSWDSGEYGAPSIDCKRPYGNSYVEGDIADILGWQYKEEEGLSEEQLYDADKIHNETKIALQICLCTQSFKVGTYEKDDLSWIKVK